MIKAVKDICSCVHSLFTFGSLYFSRRHTLSVARSAFLCKKSASLSILKEKKTCPLLLGSDASWVMLERLSAINELQVLTSFLILWFTGCSPHLDVGFWHCSVTIKRHRLNSNQPDQQLHPDVSMKRLESGIYLVRRVCCLCVCLLKTRLIYFPQPITDGIIRPDWSEQILNNKLEVSANKPSRGRPE